MKYMLSILAMLLLPLSAWAMTPVSDADLSDVTGRAGVNINADVTMNLGMGTLAWGDATGVDAYASLGTNWSADAGAGYFGVTGFNVSNLRIKAREADSYGTGYSSVGTAAPNTYNTVYLKPITIDVATDPSYVHYNGATYVRFGLGSLQVSMDDLSFAVKLGTTGAGLAASTQELGTLNLGPMELFINPRSYIDLYNPRVGYRPGVYITGNVIIDQLNLDYCSWGDSDGLGGAVHSGVPGGVTWISSAAQSGGFIGFQNISVGGPITISGTIAIDVVTSNRGVYATGHGGTPVSVCHITFPSLFTLNVAGPLTADLRLDGTAALTSANAGTLGNIYLSQVNLNILQGSWVDIWAH